MRDLIPAFAGLIFPPTCMFCQRPGHAELDLCLECLAELPFIEQACSQCALPLPVGSVELSCGRCLQRPPAFDHAVSVFEYRDRARELVGSLKYQARLPVARTLAELLWWRLRELPMPDVMLPVPLHPRRQRRRGFNQAMIIADMLARHTETPIWRTEVRRTRDTDQQTGLDAGQRRRNIRDAFATSGPLLAAHVAIIDDVVTTGSTANELAKLLKREKVKTVSLWSVARAPLDL